MEVGRSAGGPVIGVDATFVVPGRVGGAEQMLENVIVGLSETAALGCEILVLAPTGWEPPRAPNVRSIMVRSTVNRFFSGWRAVAEHRGQFDAVWFPNYFTPLVPQRSARFITTIHDLQYLHFPDHFSPRKRLWLRAAHEATLRLADVVAVISEYTRQDVLDTYGSRWRRKVVTVPNPISWRRFDGPPGQAQAVPTRLIDRVAHLGSAYILSVAAHWPHKNLATLVRAYALLKRRGRADGVPLVLVGQLGRNLVGVTKTTDIGALIGELGLERDVVVTGHVSDAELGSLYRNALVFALPSVFEGFGMPAVEALGFGLPVLTTSKTSLREVTLGLAHYMDDPFDPEEMAGRLREMVEQPANFAPGSADIARIRSHYAPARIGRLYYDLLNP